MPNPRTFPDFEVIPHFKAREFLCKCGLCRGGMMHPRLLNSLDALRRSWGKPLVIVSALRCPFHNASQRGTKGSLHIVGQAVDLAGDGIHSVEFFIAAMRAGFGGFGEGSGILHLDVRPLRAGEKPVCWSYTKKGREPGNAMIEEAWARFWAESD